ncbi:hypothetical protein ACHAPE_002657 [Trichoderma viride]
MARGSDHGLSEKPFPACSVVAVGTGPQLGLTAGLARSCPVTVPAKPPAARKCMLGALLDDASMCAASSCGLVTVQYSPDTWYMSLLPAGGGRDKNGVELGSLERDGGAWNVSGGRCLFALSARLCPSWPQRSVCVLPAETLQVGRANVCAPGTLRPAHPDAASSSYSALPSSSQPQALALCP